MSGSDSNDGAKVPWRVRFGGQTYRVKDRPSLARLVETDRVPSTAAVQPPGHGGWLSLTEALAWSPAPAPPRSPQQPAPEPPPAASAGSAGGARDPWSVWEEMDEDAPVEVPTSEPGTALPTPPPAAAAPVEAPEPPEEVEEVEELRPWRPQREVISEDSEAPGREAPAAEVAPPSRSSESVDDEDSRDRPSVGAVRPTRPPADVTPPRPAAPRRAREEGRGPERRTPERRSPERPSPERPSPERRDGSGKVIQFPGPRGDRPEVSGAHALDPAVLPFREDRGQGLTAPPPLDLGDLPPARPGPRAREHEPGTNWWRVGGFVVLCGAILVLVQGYVQMSSTAEFDGPRIAVPPGAEDLAPRLEAQASVEAGDDGVVVPEASTPAGSEPAAAASSDDYEAWRTMEEDLRSRMPRDVQEGTLEDVLLVELNRLRLDVADIDVEVLSWTGPEGDVPDSADVRILLRSDGTELEREIGGVALVVGKYAHHRDLAVPAFEVGFQGIEDRVLKRQLDVELARELYLGRLRLGAFLEKLAQR